MLAVLATLATGPRRLSRRPQTPKPANSPELPVPNLSANGPAVARLCRPYGPEAPRRDTEPGVLARIGEGWCPRDTALEPVTMDGLAYGYCSLCSAVYRISGGVLYSAAVMVEPG